MGRRDPRTADQVWSDDTAALAVADRSSPPILQPATTRPAAAKPGEGYTSLDPLPAAADIWGADRLARIAWAFIALGLVIRTVRFLLNFPLWPDEAYLAHNYLDRGYLDLLRPLDYGQVAPLLYLWLQKTIVVICGFSEYSLRLYAFVGSIASLLLFRHVSGRLLPGIARLLAIGTFAVAYPLIRYSAEAKPYGSDMLVTLVLLVLLIEWRLERRRSPAGNYAIVPAAMILIKWRPEHQGTRWFWALAVAMPVAVLLSYPAMFTVPAISLAMSIELFRRPGVPGARTRREWLAWWGVNLATAGGVALLYFASAHAQITVAGPDMQSGWEHAFPPLHSAKQMALFLLESHTGTALAYPVGGARGASLLTTVCWLTALVLLVRARRFWLATLFTAPLVLNFIAAALHIYPYLGHIRVALYMAPIFCLLTGLGGAALLSLLKNRRRPGVPGAPAGAPVVVALALLATIGCIASGRDFLKPYKESCWQRNRDFARWFWADKAQDAELLCVNTDCKLPVSLAPNADVLGSVYFCNQRIYSPRHAKCLPPQLGQVSQDHPLRCARLRHDVTTAADEAQFQDWLRSMEAKYRLVAREKYPLTFFVKERELQFVDQVELYEFVPFEHRVAAGASNSEISMVAIRR